MADLKQCSKRSKGANRIVVDFLANNDIIKIQIFSQAKNVMLSCVIVYEEGERWTIKN